MTGLLTELNEMLSTDESQTEENSLCPSTFLFSFLHLLLHQNYHKEQTNEGKHAVGHRAIQEILSRSMLSFQMDSWKLISPCECQPVEEPGGQQRTVSCTSKFRLCKSVNLCPGCHSLNCISIV